MSVMSVGSASADSLIEDYFGSVGETGSWFNVHEQEQRASLP